MDKIKDFLYEISDLIFGAIVLLAVVVISISQLNGWFNVSVPKNIEKILPVSNSNELNSDTSNISQAEASTGDTGSSSDNENSTGEDDKNLNIDTQNSDNANDTTGQNDNQSEQNEIVFRNISIASGSTSGKVADALYENNIISSREEFRLKLAQLNAETKIKAGTFRIPSDASIDEVIEIITK